MFKKYLSHILLILILIKCVVNQPPSFPRHPNDERFFDMEKKGKKPNDVNFKLENSDIPNIIVTVVEKQDPDNNADIITNKSILKISWKNNNGPNNMNTNMNNLPPSFTVKLLSNVTQDSVTKTFYSYDEQIIQPNVNGYEIEYNVPKLNENCVYNIVVVEDPKGNPLNNNIGISRSFIYQLRKKGNGVEDDTKNKGGINPLVILGIGIAGVLIIGLAFYLSKRISKNDRHLDDDKYSLPTQTALKSPDDKNSDRVSVITDDTGEVSWSNLEIAQNSKQTKNESNDVVYTTLDKRFKRGTKDKINNTYNLNIKQLYKVVRMFIPSEEDEVKLNIGDEVEITEIFEDGWCEGINKSLDQAGVFPRTCVVEAEQYASMIEKSKNSLLPNRRRSRQSYITNNRNSYNNQVENECVNAQTNSLK